VGFPVEDENLTPKRFISPKKREESEYGSGSKPEKTLECSHPKNAGIYGRSSPLKMVL